MTDPVETHQTDPARDSQPERIASVEQRLHVDVVEHETATVRVRKLVHQEVVDIPVVLKRRVVTVERVPINRIVNEEHAPRQEGDTLIVPVFEYVPVTELRLMLKEEVWMKFTETEETSVHRAEVQKEELVVERQTGKGDWVAVPATPSSKDGEQSAS